MNPGVNDQRTWAKFDSLNPGQQAIIEEAGETGLFQSREVAANLGAAEAIGLWKIEETTITGGRQGGIYGS
ncbi:MAG: hypothetical protein ACLS3C_18160 [Oscillospiraceae bacterium]